MLSQNQNNKKGGLIGLAACAIALGKVSLIHISILDLKLNFRKHQSIVVI